MKSILKLMMRDCVFGSYRMKKIKDINKISVAFPPFDFTICLQQTICFQEIRKLYSPIHYGLLEYSPLILVSKDNIFAVES
jgi:hypothetical protein